MTYRHDNSPLPPMLPSPPPRLPDQARWLRALGFERHPGRVVVLEVVHDAYKMTTWVVYSIDGGREQSQERADEQWVQR